MKRIDLSQKPSALLSQLESKLIFFYEEEKSKRERGVIFIQDKTAFSEKRSVMPISYKKCFIVLLFLSCLLLSLIVFSIIFEIITLDLDKLHSVAGKVIAFTVTTISTLAGLLALYDRYK